MAKRKLDSTVSGPSTASTKRVRVQESATPTTHETTTSTASQATSPAAPAIVEVAMDVDSTTRGHVVSKGKGKGKRTAETTADTTGGGKATASTSKHKVRKLVPPRPFPTVPASVSATGPRSAHPEGKNYICITRRTDLGAYLRKCKDVFIKDGYKSVHLSAMGAAIPHLMQLALSLPAILPFPQDEIHTEVLTGTVEVQDELIPDDEDEDISYRTRGKSTVSVVIKVEDGDEQPPPAVRASNRSTVSRWKGKPSKPRAQAPVVVREDEMDDT